MRHLACGDQVNRLSAAGGWAYREGVPRRRALPVAAREQWQLAAAALDAEQPHAADLYGGRAVELSRDWDRYPWAMMQNGVYVGVNQLLPRGRGFLLRQNWQRLLLVPLAATPFVLETAGHDFAALMSDLEASLTGVAGFVPLDEALGRLLVRAFEIPDDASGLV